MTTLGRTLCERKLCPMYSSGGFCLAPVAYKSPPVNTPECQVWAEELWEKEEE